MKSKTRPAPSRRGPRSAGRAPVTSANPNLDAGEALAFARALAGEGETRRALALLAEVTCLHPMVREAWALRGALALAVGDVALAESCSVHCAAALFRAGLGAVADIRRPVAQA